MTMYTMSTLLILTTLCVRLTLEANVPDLNGQAESVATCSDQKTCGECLAIRPDCAWCMQPDSNFNGSRCDHQNGLKDNHCEDRYIVFPDHQIDYTKNDPPGDKQTDTEAIQLSPQKVDLKLRPKTPVKFTVSFRQAANYPIDLYYIINLSRSMEPFKHEVTKLIDDIAQQMRSRTSNVRFGFGSFMDKPLRPIKDFRPNKIKDVYNFRHHLHLTENITQFTELLNDTKVSSNLDVAEDALTAVLQAVTCKDTIGWRDKARKMLLLATDDPFHIAGDGRIMGVFTPNDGQCHLHNGEYTEAANQDYPSVPRVALAVSEAQVAVMIALINGFQTEAHKGSFEKLQAAIPGSIYSIVDTVASNKTSTIVEFVNTNFEKLRSQVQLQTNKVENVDVYIQTKCKSDEWLPDGKCVNLKVGENVTFEVTVKALECLEGEQTLTIQPIGITETLEVSLRTICQCDCEQPNFQPDSVLVPQEPDPPSCSNGTYVCGQCSCNPGYFGDMCECYGSSLDGMDEDFACRMTNSSGVCQGRGRCDCGRCACDPIHPTQPEITYSGTFCQCNDYGCDLYRKELCGGPFRGTCQCGKCQCQPGYSGSNCNCTTEQQACIGADGKQCSGRGECRCGQCRCQAKYKGATCEECPSCQGMCDDSKSCVQCTLSGTGPYSPTECTTRCTHVNVVEYTLKEDEEVSDQAPLFCHFQDKEGCVGYFTVTPEEVLVQRAKECKRQLNVLAVGGGVSATVLALGITVLIVWKIYVTVHDKREYAMFIEEQQNRQWEQSENPLFKPPVSTIQNPTFLSGN